MNVNFVNIGTEEVSLSITNIDPLIRFNKTREIFPSVTWVSSILLTTVDTSASVERLGFKESAVVSDLHQDTKGSWFESGYQICAEVSSLQQ